HTSEYSVYHASHTQHFPLEPAYYFINHDPFTIKTELLRQMKRGQESTSPPRNRLDGPGANACNNVSDQSYSNDRLYILFSKKKKHGAHVAAI
ncbi:hypothetical protein ACJX0J_020393, partial [Zea mays]